MIDSRSFLAASVAELVKQLSIEEKVSLLAGKDWWNTVPIPRLDIPSVKVTDGPNGARGGSFFKMTPATAVPNATALAATFDVELVSRVGRLLAGETKARGAVSLLAPTVNIQRSPLGGRSFESFSEDPTLSGHLAAAYINGLQNEGVGSVLKHFIANDQEHERNGVDAIISPRALRELYLRPFQIAQAKSKPWAYMTSYNKLNGVHCSENPWLLNLLRKEFGHDGLVMSDWYGTYSVSEAIKAGLDLEMPGPARWRATELVQHVINAHKVNEDKINERVTHILTWIQKLARANEELVFNPVEEYTRARSVEETRVVRESAGDSIVLLKNEGVLPLRKGRVAVIGPNAKDRVLTGGGSAQLRSSWSQSPWQGLVSSKPDSISLSYSLGTYTSKFLPFLDENFTCTDGSPGFDLLHYPIVNGVQASSPVIEEKFDHSYLLMADFHPPELTEQYFTEIKAVLKAPEDGEYEFGLMVTGQGWLWVDEVLVIDNGLDQVRDTTTFSSGTAQATGRISVRKGQSYSIRMLHDTRPPPSTGKTTPLLIHAVRLGASPVEDPEASISSAVQLAQESDVAVVVVGLNPDWESEGFDRSSLSLPLRSDELISSVAAVNKNTVVIVQAGSAISMPWLKDVAAVVHAWYGGNETGNAIADIIYGSVNPSGRLPITFPKREEDIAATLNFKSARTKVHYEEGIWVGYKHHYARKIEPLFPFGYGLSYTTFEYSDLSISTSVLEGNQWVATASVKVTNTGTCPGRHSVHFYLCPPEESSTGLKHPSHSLQAFAKTSVLQPGSLESVTVSLDKYAVSHWDEYTDSWRAEVGTWTLKIGIDAQTLWGEEAFELLDSMPWRGL